MRIQFDPVVCWQERAMILREIALKLERESIAATVRDNQGRIVCQWGQVRRVDVLARLARWIWAGLAAGMLAVWLTGC